MKRFVRVFYTLTSFTCLILVILFFFPETILLLNNRRTFVKIKYGFHESENNKFIVNNRILQYSSYARIKNSQSIEFDVILLLNYENEKSPILISNFLCLIKTFKTNSVEISTPKSILRIYLMEIPGRKKELYKFSCITSESKYPEEVRIAVIDQRDYEIQEKNSDLIPSQYILFQKPKIVDTRVPRKKKVVNCVHSMRNIEKEKLHYLFTWLRLQKRIGYDKIRIYHYDLNEETIKNVHKKFGEDFVEFVYYALSEKEICETQYALLETNPKSTLLILCIICIITFCKYLIGKYKWFRKYIWLDIRGHFISFYLKCSLIIHRI